MKDRQEDNGNDASESMEAYYLSQGPYVQPDPVIPEDWVESRIDLPLAQIRSSASNRVRMMTEDTVMDLQVSILRYGYWETRNSVFVRAIHGTADAVPADDPGTAQAVSQVYEVLDGHHRFAALLGLQARNLLPREYALPVVIVRDTVPRERLYAFQCFLNMATGHTNERVDHTFANVN